MKWFISDLHLDYPRVLQGPRGQAFPSINMWSTYIIKEINELLDPKDDTLYLVGDTACKDLQTWRDRLTVQDVWFIHGNHDPDLPECRKVFGDKAELGLEIPFGDNTCWLHHYPTVFWPRSHYNAYHIYGHTHGQREDTLDEWMPERRALDVCPENIYRIWGQWRPVNELEILQHLQHRKGHDDLKFYQKLRGVYSD